jgi:anti-sigma regulatory factor (Ser/Thr protein kinase)
MTREMTLEIPVDPAYAVTARLFVATAAWDLGLSEGTIEDLRLAASELVANAVETDDPGPIRMALTLAGSDVHLEASGVGRLSQEPPISRLALLEALFDAEHIVQDGPVRIRVSAPDRQDRDEA